MNEHVKHKMTIPIVVIQSKLLRTIKLFLILCMLSFCVSAFAASAQSVNVKLTLNDPTVAHVIEKLHQQTGYEFSYDADILSKKLPDVSIDAKNEHIEIVLSRIFGKTDISFKVMNNRVFLKNNKASATSALQSANTAQQPAVRKISGTVKDDRGEPVIGATIVVQGDATKGTVTDIDGNFILADVPENAILQFTFVGMKTQKISTAAKSTIDVILEADTELLDEVVVTALGIKREKKALGYATQEVKGELLQIAKEPNVLSSLTGRVAGLTIKNQPGLFENPDITLRGNSNILVVIDGIPRETNFWDVNSDDIDEMTVLKGPAAAALYGSRGKNGAIMITTKRGAREKVEVSINSSFMFQPNFVFLPKRQIQYGQGGWGKFEYVDGAGSGTYDSDVYSWGPKLDQRDPNTPSGWVELPQWNSPIDPETGKRIPLPFISRGKKNIENFFQTGNVISNNISIGANNERGDFRLSLTQLDQKGIDPNSRLDATTVSLSGNQAISKLLTLSASVTYNKQYTDNYPRTSYYSDNNMYNIMVWMSPDVDVRDLKQYWTPGKEGVKQRNYNYAYYNNPYFIANEFLQEYKKDVVYGYAALKFDISPDLKFTLRSNINTFNRYIAEKRPKGFVGYAAGYMNGGFYPNNYFEFDMNNEFLFTYDKALSDKWLLNVVFGGNSRKFNSRSLNVSASSLSIPEVYNLGNSSEPLKGSNYIMNKEVNSLYGSANIGYNNMLYLTVTGRNDWSSAMPVKNNSYFYPSITLSGIVSEMLRLPEFISFAKIRGSWIRVGGDMSPYSIKPAYNYGTTWGTTPSIYMGSVLPSLDIEPDFKTTYEIGGDIRLFANRLGLDITYYNDLESNMITNSEISIASGYTTRKINSSKKTRRVGWEVSLNASPIKTKKLFWDIGLNWSTNSQYLVRAEEGKNGRDGYVAEGGKYGYMWHKSEIDHSADGRAIYKNGLPVVTPDAQNFGYARSRWESGLTNRIGYKNITLSFSIDGRWGGLIYSRLNQKLWESGLHYDSATPETSKYRDADNEGQKTYIGDGVIVTGGEIIRDTYGNVISDTRTYKENDIPVYYRTWSSRYYHQAIWSTSTFDASFFKLREVVIGYKLPKSILSHVKLKEAEVSLIGRNLYLWTKADGNIDPDVNANDGEARLYVPTPRNIGFNIKLNF